MRKSTGCRLRTAIEGGIALFLALLFLQTWFIDGLTVPYQICSGSMAPALLGMHRDVVCADCGFAFSCDSTPRPISPRAVCPNCGYAKNDLESLPDLDGDRVLIERSVFYYRPPRRWEIVAFRRSQDGGKILIKRVVGLPGESIEVRHGDVYINGEIPRKTLAQQRSMAIPVYDADYSPALAPAQPPRWQGEKLNSRWNSARGRFMRPNSTDNDREPAIDWLVYHHYRRLPGQNGGAEQCPITDIMGYNQTLPRREEDVHAVSDLLLSFRLVNVSGRGLFYLRATVGKHDFQVEIDPRTGRYRATCDGRDILQQSDRLPFDIKGAEVVLSTIDRQFLFSLDGHIVFCRPIEDTVLESESTSQPFALGAKKIGVEVKDLRIYRDVFYTHPIGVRARWALEKPFHLGDHEYFVLGDNSPIADDSRTWPKNPAVSDNLLIGKPFMILLPVKSMVVGQWHFQVPDLSRIRYIR
jgi:signal peptidase I